jgi:hypothetical protein
MGISQTPDIFMGVSFFVKGNELSILAVLSKNVFFTQTLEAREISVLLDSRSTF